MRRRLTPLLVTTILALSQPICAITESDSAANWRPIAEITDLEKAIIAEASRKDADAELKSATAFTVKDGIIRLLLYDDSIKYFGANNVLETNWTEETKSGSESTKSQQKRFVKNEVKARTIKGLLGEFLDLLNDGDADIKIQEAIAELISSLIDKTEQEQIFNVSDILKKSPMNQIALKLEAKLLSRTLDELDDLDKVKTIDRIVEILEQTAPIKNQNRQNREENYHYVAISENSHSWSLPSPLSEIFSALLTLRSLEKNYPQLAPKISFNQALNIFESKGIIVTKNP